MRIIVSLVHTMADVCCLYKHSPDELTPNIVFPINRCMYVAYCVTSGIVNAMYGVVLVDCFGIENITRALPLFNFTSYLFVLLPTPFCGESY